MAAETDTKLSPALLEYFDGQSTYAKPVLSFKPNLVNSISSPLERQIAPVLAIDLGGSTLSWASFHTMHGRILQLTETILKPSQMGQDYLEWLENLARVAGHIPVGISSTGSIEKTVLTRTNNLPLFKQALNERYKGDFANLFAQSCKLTVINDAVAGTMGALHDLTVSDKLSPVTKSALYLINGSGINAAVWQADQIWATELGAIKIHPQLAERLQLDKTDTLQVRPIAAGRGIEARWEKKTGKKLSGWEIARQYQDGHPLAERLYAESALVAAHVVVGLGQNFGLFETPESTMLICHGGVFSVPGYADKLKEYLTAYFRFPLQLVVSGNHQENPGLKGAALTALYDLTNLSRH